MESLSFLHQLKILEEYKNEFEKKGIFNYFAKPKSARQIVESSFGSSKIKFSGFKSR